MTGSIKRRLEKLEQQESFQDWFESMRILESFNEEQIHDIVVNGRFPTPLPEPPPAGESRLDHLDRKTLHQMWEKNEREFGGRTEEEMNFFLSHGHWPEQTCRERRCEKVSGGQNVPNIQS